MNKTIELIFKFSNETILQYKIHAFIEIYI